MNKKLLLYLLLLLGSIFIFFNLKSTKNVDMNVKEYESFPPKEYLEELKGKAIQ